MDREGKPTTDPFQINGLLPISGAKGYGLMMMVDILCGALIGAPFGPHVTSMYADLSSGRELGQIHIVIDPGTFGAANFGKTMTAMMEELHGVQPASGCDQVLYPGESSERRAQEYKQSGIPIVKEIYEYLTSDTVHFDRYDQGNPFAIHS